jgi:hypothetical protein
MQGLGLRARNRHRQVRDFVQIRGTPFEGAEGCGRFFAGRLFEGAGAHFFLVNLIAVVRTTETFLPEKPGFGNV